MLYIYTQHSECDHRLISSATQLINQQSSSSWKSWWSRNCMLFDIWSLVAVFTKAAMELHHEPINCSVHPTALTFIIFLLPVGILSGFFTWDFLNKMHEFFISMVHPACHPVYITTIGNPWLALEQIYGSPTDSSWRSPSSYWSCMFHC